MIRREFLALLAAAAATPGAALTVGDGEPFSPELVTEMARTLGTTPFRPRPTVPQEWQNLTYDQYRKIWFDTRNAGWEGTDAALRVDIFHPGLYFPSPVKAYLVESGRAKPVRFDLNDFAMTDRAPHLPMDETLGPSGIRLRAQIDGPNYTEFAVFQGASYFRMHAPGQVYGLSARGLAIDTGGEEEFPDFTAFWVERPEAGATDYTVHALMDSPSVAGAYRFDISMGDAVVTDVTATLFPRRALPGVGVAPLTSMFLYDQTNRHRFPDWRPAIHDSDGLAIRNGAGEVLWRPLANPGTLQFSAFVDTNPRGFGLAQRAREFGDFADLEAHYHKRPSLWIEPLEDWGRGSVVLVEIPADKEIYDNIVAFWRPSGGVRDEHRMSYRMTWADDVPTGDVAHVVNTHVGAGFDGAGIVSVIDFAAHPDIPDDLEAMTIHLAASTGEVSGGILQRNPETGGPRLAFTLEPGEATISELRAQLRHEGRAVTEVWLYRWLA